MSALYARLDEMRDLHGLNDSQAGVTETPLRMARRIALRDAEQALRAALDRCAEFNSLITHPDSPALYVVREVVKAAADVLLPDEGEASP